MPHRGDIDVAILRQLDQAFRFGERTGHQKDFASTTPFALTFFRTQLFNPEDMPNVRKCRLDTKGAIVWEGRSEQLLADGELQNSFLGV
jgi:hypothetical protein